MEFLSLFLGCLLGVALVFLGIYWGKLRGSERVRKGLEQELEGVKRGAEEEQKRKKDLVAFLAHDLKTPLTSVVGYLTLLRDKPDLPREERQRFTGVALDKARRLEELLGEFFDISRMELQQEPQEMAEVQLTVLLEQVADEFYPILQEKQLTFALSVEEKLTVTGDGEKLARVFDNVLRNAVSYSTPGGEVRLDARRAEGRVVVTISNQGLGIPEGELSNIFNKFYRLDAARSSATGGAGLGLAIAKEIVEHHGGTISAESTGHETSFRIALPG